MEAPPVVVWYGDDAEPWGTFVANFIDKCYGVKVMTHAIENLHLPLTDARVRPFKRAKIQIVILSPTFLEYVDNNQSILLGKLFEPCRVIAVMCGVNATDITSFHRANLISFESWKTIEVTDKDPTFHSSFQNYIDEILKNTQSILDDNQTKDIFKLHPCKVREGCSKVVIEFLKEIPANQQICVIAKTEDDKVQLKAKLSNSHLGKFVVPNKFFEHSQIIQIHLTCGSHYMGWRPLKCESKMAELNNLLQSINTPMSFMCQTLGLTTGEIDELDRYLVNAFRKNTPKINFQLFDFGGDFQTLKVAEEFPTLLHFAAKYGLNELCATILDCPGASSACQILNKSGRTPADLAAINNHRCLASMLDNYMSLSETAEMYTYMKSMTDDLSNADYTNLDARFQESLKLAARNSSCSKDEYIKSISVATPFKLFDGNYGPDSSSAIKDNDGPICLRARPPNSKPSNLHLYSQSQQELIQLLEDFKQEKYTIGQVELLFQDWQSRQTAESFKEKNDKLVEMQCQYEQIKKSCQESNKKRTALERFKSFLVATVKKDDISACSDKVPDIFVREKCGNNADGTPTIRIKSRPTSAWSCSSHGSSLSDRSSTMSALSINSTSSDSGASSDIGEERLEKLPIIEEQSPKLLAKTWNPPCMENRQYMFMNTGLPLPPERPPKKVSLVSAVGKPPQLSSHPPVNIYPTNNTATNGNQMDIRSPSNTPSYLEIEDPYSPLGIAPAPPDANAPQTFEGYLTMGVANHLKSDLGINKIESRFCTAATISSSDTYVKMKPEMLAAPQVIARNHKMTPGAFSYLNCPQEDNSYIERCDSVPDVPAPSIPISGSEPNKMVSSSGMTPKLLSTKLSVSSPSVSSSSGPSSKLMPPQLLHSKQSTSAPSSPKTVTSKLLSSQPLVNATFQVPTVKPRTRKFSSPKI